MDFNTGMTVYHREFGMGRVVNKEADRIVVNFVKAGIKYFKYPEAGDELSDSPFEEKGPSLDDVISSIREMLWDEGLIGETEIANKWEGGQVILKPGKADLQEKVMPVESLFRKIVMIRDRLRVLEQHINSNEKLSDADKINLQQYITRCYGSLTTFNVLFSDRKDWFVGEKEK